MHAASYGGRRRNSDAQSGSSGRRLPPAVARLPSQCPWTCRAPVKVAGHVSLSLMHVKVQESPLFCDTFHFGPLTFDFVFCPDFGWISFDLVRLGPPIGID